MVRGHAERAKPSVERYAPAESPYHDHPRSGFLVTNGPASRNRLQMPLDIRPITPVKPKIAVLRSTAHVKHSGARLPENAGRLVHTRAPTCSDMSSFSIRLVLDMCLLDRHNAQRQLVSVSAAVEAGTTQRRSDRSRDTHSGLCWGPRLPYFGSPCVLDTCGATAGRVGAFFLFL